MNSLYGSMVINGSDGWGDGVPVLWLVEHLRQTHGFDEIYVWDGGNRETCKYHLVDKFYHRKYIKKPSFVTDFLDGPPDKRRFSKILCTHFKAPYPTNFALEWAAPPFPDPLHGGLLTPALYLNGPPAVDDIIYMDLNSSVHDLLRNKDFTPSMPDLVNVGEGVLELAVSDFICVQFRCDDPWGGDILYGDEYVLWATELLEKISMFSKVVVLSDMPPPTNTISERLQSGKIVDATRWSFWEKISVSSTARRSVCSHSGFGLLMSGYNSWSRTMLINAKAPTDRMPPLQCFANGDRLLREGSGNSSICHDDIIQFLR